MGSCVVGILQSFKSDGKVFCLSSITANWSARESWNLPNFHLFLVCWKACEIKWAFPMSITCDFFGFCFSVLAQQITFHGKMF